MLERRSIDLRRPPAGIAISASERQLRAVSKAVSSRPCSCTKSLALQEQREAFRQLGISETAIDEINIEQVDFEDDNFIPENHQISTSLDEVTGPRATNYFRSWCTVPKEQQQVTLS
jgi:hypothetical protein